MGKIKIVGDGRLRQPSLLFKLFGRWSLDDALKELGEYDPTDDGPRTVVEVKDLFKGETVELEESIDVELKISSGRNCVSPEQVSRWMNENKFESIRLKHMLAISLQHPKEQEERPIYMLGPVQGVSLVLGYAPPPGQPAGSFRRKFSVFKGVNWFSPGSLFGAIKSSAK